MLQKYGKILFLICLISFLSRFTLDSYLPSLPAIQQFFGLTSGHTQFTLTIYLLSFGFSQLIFGPLSDRYGRKKILLAGMILFFMGTCCCGFANSSFVLFFGRVLMGAGAGCCGTLNRTIASDCFKGTDFSKAWSYTTTTLVLALIVAPLIGGLIETELNWSSNFIFSGILIAITFFILIKSLPETHAQSARIQMNVKQVLQNYQMIFTTPSFLISTLCYTLAFSGLIIYFQITPFLFMDQLKLSALEYGLTSLVIAGTYLCGGMIVNRFSKQLGLKKMLLLGTLLLLSSGLMLTTIVSTGFDNLVGILVPSAIFVIGARIVIPNAVANAFEELRHLKGSSSALMGCIQMLGSTIISFAIAHCNNTNALPLAFFLTGIGAGTLILLFYNDLRQFHTQTCRAATTGLIYSTFKNDKSK